MKANLKATGQRGGRATTPRFGPRSSALAFTILEIMLAMGIFALVLTAIYSIWVAILKGSQAGLKAAAQPLPNVHIEFLILIEFEKLQTLR